MKQGWEIKKVGRGIVILMVVSTNEISTKDNFGNGDYLVIAIKDVS